jgi:hypothetical protein
MLKTGTVWFPTTHARAGAPEAAEATVVNEPSASVHAPTRASGLERTLAERVESIGVSSEELTGQWPRIARRPCSEDGPGKRTEVCFESARQNIIDRQVASDRFENGRFQVDVDPFGATRSAK